jgi:hypothetical protein
VKPHRLIAPLALALVALFVWAAPPAAHATTCRHAEVVFYSTDTLRLALRLSLDQSACADYYISVTPTADGSPRGGVAPTVRSYGPNFHAMPEIRLALWAKWLQANPGKTWYDAGVDVRRRMGPAGFDLSKGDTWAINEIGTPSTQQQALDVFTDAGTARADLRDFVRGLYTGNTGMPPAPGLVFAADPPQITSDLSQYKQQLEDFYGDSPFWTDMSAYVRFWAQETYADARTWGVAGSAPTDRLSHLNDYFQHGLLLAEAGPGSTDAALSFLDGAYTPVANASYPYTEPELNPGGIGFGYTNLTLTQMQNFVSTQTDALRSFSSATGAPDRFGFAWSPNTKGFPRCQRRRTSRSPTGSPARSTGPRPIRRRLRRIRRMVRQLGRRRAVHGGLEDLRRVVAADEHAGGIVGAGTGRAGRDGDLPVGVVAGLDAADDVGNRSGAAARRPAPAGRSLLRPRDDRELHRSGRRLHRLRRCGVRRICAAAVPAR